MEQQKKGLLDASDSVICLLDHQAGFFKTVKDIGVAELRANTTMLAKAKCQARAFGSRSHQEYEDSGLRLRHPVARRSPLPLCPSSRPAHA